jgi:hypothetical protein
MAASDLTTVAAVEAWGGIPSGSGDAIVQSLITAVSAWISSYCARSFVGVTAYSEIRNGNGQQEMYLAEAPVQAITSLTIGSTVIPVQPAINQAGYFLIPSSDAVGCTQLALYGYEFCRGRRNIFISYTAGWSSIPLEITQACNELVVSAYRRGARGPDLRSQVIDAQTISFDLKAMPVTAAAMLNKYRKIVPL